MREPTAGAVVFRKGRDFGIQILLIQDAKDRWTIPKGHIEEGEDAKTTAIREIGEETGLTHVKVLDYMGQVEFKYQRDDVLVLMVTQVYLMEAVGHEDVQKEEWMHGIHWFDFKDALEIVEYVDVRTLIEAAQEKVRNLK
ncbi:MAG: NUDIX domain-containing protein [Candidatus Nomurabacteria bacterium]|nr:NUDIX domain-containing protein [Candidatus Nomurabacteria bacterium]